MKRALVVLILSALMFSSAHAQTLTFKLGHFAAETHPGALASKMFAEGVDKRTEGKVKISIYPDNALGSPTQVLERTIGGSVDMALPTQGHLGKYSEKFKCVMLPFVFESYAHADKVLDGPFMSWVTEDFEKTGLVFLSNWEWGFRNLTNRKRPVNTPADVRGLMVRIPPELPIRVAMEALGAIVANVDFNDLQKALKEGAIDGQENPVAVIYANRLYETQKHLALTGHTYNSMVHVVSKRAWGKLSPEQQAIVKEESAKAGYWIRRTLREAEASQIESLKQLGVQVTYPDRSKFKSLMGPAYKRMEIAAGEQNIKEFLKMVEAVK